MRNEPQLITYVDRLAGDLDGLAQLLNGPIGDAFGGVHLLPFFNPIDGSDAGFDPIDHTSVDPRLGTWSDLEPIAEGRDLMADVIVNHVSADSPQFIDWVKLGSRSEFDGMFLTYDSVFPDGATADDLLSIYRPRPGLCFTVREVDGAARLVWTTFTAEQIDIDLGSPAARDYVWSILGRFAASGVNLVRLDAVGYAVKKAGTSCFMIPETFGFIDELSTACAERGMEVLVEIHGYHRTQIQIARRVDRVYDFALPPLVLDALYRESTDGLAAWLAIRPTNAVTVLDTHDGIGVVDIGRDQADHDRPGLLPQRRIDELVEEIHRRSNGTSRLATGEAANNLDLYQVNCTFFDALGADDDLYLLARLIQVLVPGVPQIYYVGLLAGGNDVDLLELTGVGRDINRHYFDADEIAIHLARPVVKRLLTLLGWRRRSPLFDGEFSWSAQGPILRFNWVTADASLAAKLDLEQRRFRLTFDGDDEMVVTDLLQLADR